MKPSHTRERHRALRWGAGGLAGGVAVVGLTVAPATAELYEPWEVNGGGASLVTNWTCEVRTPMLGFVPERGNGVCIERDAVDGSWFLDDPGGRAGKIVVTDRHAGQPMAGKVEFHPQGEHLYVYDTLNDGKSFRVTLDGKTYRAPSTGKVIDIAHHDLSLRDGRVLTLSAWGRDYQGTKVSFGAVVVVA